MLGWTELAVILFIVLVIFGAGKLPEVGSSLGKGIKNFRKALKEPDAIDVTPGHPGHQQEVGPVGGEKSEKKKGG